LNDLKFLGREYPWDEGLIEPQLEIAPVQLPSVVMRDASGNQGEKTDPDQHL
jgi:hypothetical protein